MSNGLYLAAVALGSNLKGKAGDPEETVRAAMERLSTLGEVTARSSLYKTEPVSDVAQPPYVNAAVLLRTKLEPVTLLKQLLKLEREFGRVRAKTVHKGPRTLDLDLLLAGETVMGTALLTLPHPEMAKRRFVLEPLAEIAPRMRHPVLGKTVAELLQALPEEGPNAADAVRQLPEPEAR